MRIAHAALWCLLWCVGSLAHAAGAVAIAPSRSNVIYYVNQHGWGLRSDDRDTNTAYAWAAHGLFATRNAGASWERIDEGVAWRSTTLQNHAVVQGVAADPARAGSLYAATAAGLFQSADFGRTWTKQELTPASNCRMDTGVPVCQ